MPVRQLVLQQNSLAFQLVLQQSTASNAVQLYLGQINSADCDAANQNPYNANQIWFRHDDNVHEAIINCGRPLSLYMRRSRRRIAGLLRICGWLTTFSAHCMCGRGFCL